MQKKKRKKTVASVEGPNGKGERAKYTTKLARATGSQRVYVGLS